jgi:hypothetical protein
MSENNAYVYGHYKADTGELFYIGKGTGNRAWQTWKRNPYWKNVVNKHGFTVKLLHENLTEEDAYEKEKQLIAEVGLMNLTNITEGGIGITSEISKQLVEKRNSNPEYRKKHMKGVARRTQDIVWRNNQVEKNKNLANNSEWKARVRNGTLNSWKNSERRAKASERTKKLLETLEYRQKLEETKAHKKKKALLISPEGQIYNLHGVKKFAREHNLNYSYLARLIRKERKTYKGWQLYNPEEDHKISELT